MSTLQSVRGMNDILPPTTALWNRVERLLADHFASYGYREIRFPILERSELFARTIGEVTDIVEKEMYSFADRNGDLLAMRPEGTAGCVRAVLQNGLLGKGPQKLWYSGPMFRYERPQKGRQRQFHQFGVECFGYEGPDADAELIAMTASLWEKLDITDGLQLELNSLGTSASRQAHRDELLKYFKGHKNQLDEDSLRRLESNPLRILDSKNPDMQGLIEAAPRLQDYFDAESSQHLAGLTALLSDLGIPYRINHRLVRGLDYYSRTVFEWTTDRLGAQGTVCGGGRYDALVEQLGGAPTPALGFGLGMERLILLLEEMVPGIGADEPIDHYLIASVDALPQAMALAEQLRRELPQRVTINHLGGGSFKNQFKRADRSGARVALVLGEEEVAKGTVTLKYLREMREQEVVDRSLIVERLRSL